MKQKNVLILSGVTVAALAVAAFALRARGTTSTSGQRLLFPELAEHLNDLTEVRLEKGGKTATLRRDGGQWKLADRGGYPAQFEKVKELAVKVSELQIEREMTAKKANHAKMSVAWPAPAEEGSEGAEAALATFKDAGGKELAALVVGKTEWQGSKPKIYARRSSDDQVYLCRPSGSGSLDVMPEARNWIEAKFLELDNERVQTVTIEHADGETVDIARSATNHTQFKVQNLPPGQDEKYEGVATGVATALSNVQLDDVRPVTEVDFAKEPLGKARFRTVDGLELVVETAKFEDKTWVKVAAVYTPPPEPPAPEQPAEPAAEGAEGAAAPAGDQPAEAEPAEPEKDVGKEAADLNERLSPWAFEVASYKSDLFVRRMKDLVAEPTPPGGEDTGVDGVMQELGLPAEEDQGAIEPAPAPDDEKDAAPPADGGTKPE